MNTSVGFIILLIILFSALLAMVLVVMSIAEQSDDSKSSESIQNQIERANYSRQNGWAKIQLQSLARKTISLPALKIANTTIISSTTEAFTMETVYDARSITISNHSRQFMVKTTKKPRRISSVTITLNGSFFHNPHMDDYFARYDGIPTQDLKLLTEIKPTDGKVMSLIEKNDTVYIIKENGIIETLNEDTLEPMTYLKTNFSLRKIGFLTKERGAVIEMDKEILSIFDIKGKILQQLLLFYRPKDLQIYDDKIFILSGSNNEIYVYDTELRLESSIKFKNNQKETCNFILLYEKYIFLSCQSAIYKIDEIGKQKQIFKTADGSYSLGIALIKRRKLLLAVQRGQPQIHIFDNTGKLRKKLVQVHSSSALWSSMVVVNNRIYTLDYITSVIRVFDLPSLSWSDWEF